MKKLEIKQMEEIQGGGCAGAVLGSVAVTVGALGLCYLSGGALAAGLAGWIAAKAAATVNMIEDCASYQAPPLEEARVAAVTGID